MSFGDDLHAQVVKVLREQWTEREGYVVPTSDDIQLGNDAVKINAAVLYADIDASTNLVDGYKPWFAAEVYKVFLYCAAKIVHAETGEITAYDGDRLMAVFLGDAKETNAARAALKLNYARAKIIQPAIQAQYPKNTYTLKHVVGIDSSSLYVARTGIRGANDLVWIGRAANYAAKLSTLSSDYPTYITKDMYDKLDPKMKTSEGKAIWSATTWSGMNDLSIYGSTWWWSIP